MDTDYFSSQRQILLVRWMATTKDNNISKGNNTSRALCLICMSVLNESTGPPSAPRNITFATTCDHLTAAWTPPDSDGGLPLTRYAVELKDLNGWSDAVFVGVKTNRFTFTSREGVKPRTAYIVTVQAFNQLKTGEIGEGSVTSAYCKYRR